MKNGRFKIPIYGFTINISLVEDTLKTTEYYSYLIKRFKMPSEGNQPCEGFVFQKEFKLWIVFAENKISHNLLAHECSHATFKILNTNGIQEGNDNEQFALLNGFLNENVIKIINKLSCNKITI